MEPNRPMEPISIFELNEPAFTHDCDRCEFLYSIRLVQGTNERCLDVYKQCWFEDRYLLRYSDEGSNYASGLDTKGLITKLFVQQFIHESKENQ